jgi:aspartyl-tRNA(Asn)/glutamyl-tRNA(Gln) amidotransferase subunit B
MGYPGTLPRLNRAAMEKAYLVARALNCTLAPETGFERKNYFYPDLPKNYQISQFVSPVGTDGYIDIEFRHRNKRVRIHECHLEEDAGKMIHAGDMSLLDYNRAGTPLLEIVTEPDLEIGEEAETLLLELRRIVRYLGVSDGNMDEGSLRCDANVSINPAGAGLGRKVEIKNLNSSRFVRLALNYEIERQEEILERGGTVRQETRQWNENRDVSETMRTKESAKDYRYFPEPDLPLFRPDESFLGTVEGLLVELPHDRRMRLKQAYGLTDLQVGTICDERQTADFFEETIALGTDSATVASWMISDVKKLLNRSETSLADGPLTPKRLAELLSLLADGRIHGRIAKQVLEAVFEDDADPAAIVEARGWEQMSDRGELESLVRTVLSDNGKAVEQIREGDNKPIGFLIGQVMQASSGRADPKQVKELIKAQLSLSIVQVLSFGGAIAGRRRSDGLIEPGNLLDVKKAFEQDPALPNTLRFEEVQLGSFLSEEITPADWAALISTVAGHLEESNSGIVIGHGTDTLAYTASLLHWLFGDAGVPIVLTAASVPSDSSDEAMANLRSAVLAASQADPGVYVVYGPDRFPGVNLRFERAATTGAASTAGFRTWNAARAENGDSGSRSSWRPLGRVPLADRAELRTRLERAIGSTFIARVYPGMRGEMLTAVLKTGVRNVILEIFDTGTASLRESPFSLREAFDYAEREGARFYCTSQQEGLVDFSGYVTGHELWRHGAVAMGELNTESAYTRLIAAAIVSESEDELRELMEDF